MCKVIASRLGQVLDIDDNSVYLDNYRRIRVNMDITKPLCRFQNVRGRDGKVFRIDLAYFRFFFFCVVLLAIVIRTVAM